MEEFSQVICKIKKKKIAKLFSLNFILEFKFITKCVTPVAEFGKEVWEENEAGLVKKRKNEESLKNMVEIETREIFDFNSESGLSTLSGFYPRWTTTPS